jgi:hypothetical protein
MRLTLHPWILHECWSNELLEDIKVRLWLSWACAVVFTETQAIYAALFVAALRNQTTTPHANSALCCCAFVALPILAASGALWFTVVLHLS